MLRCGPLSERGSPTRDAEEGPLFKISKLSDAYLFALCALARDFPWTWMCGGLVIGNRRVIFMLVCLCQHEFSFWERPILSPIGPFGPHVASSSYWVVRACFVIWDSVVS